MVKRLHGALPGVVRAADHAEARWCVHAQSQREHQHGAGGRGLVSHMEIRAHKLSMRNPKIPYEYWIDRYNLIRGNYGYKGFAFSFGIDQLWNFFY